MGRIYSSEEIDLGLTAYALEGGNGKRVSAILQAAGLKIPIATVEDWAYRRHAERYQRISAEVEEQVRHRLRDQFHRLARTSAELSEDILARMQAQLASRDSELVEVQEALDRLGEIGEDDKETLSIRKELWKLRDRLRVNLRELGDLLAKSGVQGGIATDKLQLLSGQPTQLVQHSFPEIRAALERKGVVLDVGQGRPPAPVEPAAEVPKLPVGSSNGYGA